MKNILLIVITIFVVNFNVSAFAENTIKSDRKVDAKCYIELINGQQMIHFAYVKEDSVNRLVDTLTDKKVSSPLFKKKQQVAQAFECVLMDAKFNSAKANELFDKQPR